MCEVIEGTVEEYSQNVAICCQIQYVKATYSSMLAKNSNQVYYVVSNILHQPSFHQQ